MPEGLMGSPSRTTGLRNKLKTQQEAPKSPIEAMKEKGTLQPAMPEVSPQQIEQAAVENLGIKASADEGTLDQKYQELSDTFNKKLAGLDKSDSAWLQQEYDKLNKEKERAGALYEQARNRAEWAEIANTIGQAFVKLGAAYEGAKTGRNISSGVPFQKQDWSNTYNRLLQDYRMKLDNLEDNMRQKKEIRAADTKTGREGIRRDYQAAIKDIAKAQAEQERAKKEILKEAKTAEKAQEKLEKEREKRDAGYEKVKGLVRDLDEGRVKEDKVIPQIRNELVKLGHTDEDFQKALTEADDASWFGNDWTVLYNYINDQQGKMNKRFGTSEKRNPKAGPTEVPDNTKVFNPDELPDI